MVAVSYNYGALQENYPGLANTISAATNVHTSILIVPSYDSDLLAAIDSKANQFESGLANELSDRTQLTYNCTTASNLWNLLEDPDVLELIEFHDVLDNSTSAGDGSDTTTEEERKIVAIASIRAKDCSMMRELSFGRVVMGNSFFGPAINTTLFLYDERFCPWYNRG
ncbi:hypothetical protein PHYPSEUDO_009746 [Phytophthora pseudosyringae]|uniref:Uncharacterized protein n=1 Tax=Phytophthora pseudosyringae TaxID=221518 RepID=A0A8T1VBK0_9STRA|nr:hypothetical protein PHYPSEUDO_009746 [Phytophthora pseudosyringae]